jgi:hypothetical protein
MTWRAIYLTGLWLAAVTLLGQFAYLKFLYLPPAVVCRDGMTLGPDQTCAVTILVIPPRRPKEQPL